MNYLFITLMEITMGVAMIWIVVQFIFALIMIPLRQFTNWVMEILKGRKANI